jgi:radical S-adenosyl methionine domain-containing protein 2
LRNANSFAISSEQFESFVKCHEKNNPVAESNEKMKNSYLILDEFMRFLNCTKDGKEPSESILQVGVQIALEQSGFDREMFVNRGGIYDWTNNQSCSSSPELDW